MFCERIEVEEDEEEVEEEEEEEELDLLSCCKEKAMICLMLGYQIKEHEYLCKRKSMNLRAMLLKLHLSIRKLFLILVSFFSSLNQKKRKKSDFHKLFGQSKEIQQSVFRPSSTRILSQVEQHVVPKEPGILHRNGSVERNSFIGISVKVIFVFGIRRRILKVKLLSVFIPNNDFTSVVGFSSRFCRA